MALSALMPMHITIGPTGHITSVGHSMQRLGGERKLLGNRLTEVFEIHKPRIADASMDRLHQIAGQRLLLSFREAPRTQFKGIFVPIDGDEGLLLNLSFGIGAMAAVEDYELSNSDFAPTDLTIEMLYLNEAKRVLDAEFRRMNENLESSRDAAQLEAMTDPLTGLHNRRSMEETLADAIASDTPFTLFQVDLDFFKQINDTKGHAAGDHVLVVASERMLANVRDVDFVARVGGDEFVILAFGQLDGPRKAQLAADLITDLERDIKFEGDVCNISGSIGYCSSQAYDAPKPDQMLADADAALYEVKKAGRGHAVEFKSDGSSEPPVAA